MKNISSGKKIFLIIIIILLSVNIMPTIDYAQGAQVILVREKYKSTSLLGYIIGKDIADSSFSIFGKVAVPYYIAIFVLLVLIVISKKRKNVYIFCGIIICIIVFMLISLNIMNKKNHKEIINTIRNNNSEIFDCIKLNDQENEIYVVKYKSEDKFYNAVKIINDNEFEEFWIDKMAETENENIIIIKGKTYKIQK